MSDANAIIGLIGVAIGGIIGNVSTIIQQRYTHKRWKSEAQIAHLKAQRKRFEKVYAAVIQALEKGDVQENEIAKITASQILHFPPKLRRIIRELDGNRSSIAMSNKEKDDYDTAEIERAMREHLDEFDKTIRNLLS